jgi:hypothetical protein
VEAGLAADLVPGLEDLRVALEGLPWGTDPVDRWLARARAAAS